MVAMSTIDHAATTPEQGSGAGAASPDESIAEVEHQLSLLWRRARSVSQRLSREVHPDMEPAAYGLLSVLRTRGPIRLTELAAWLGVGKPSVSRQVAFLEGLGLVSKAADPLDGRAQAISLTALGEEKMHLVQDARREVFRDRLAEWPAGDLAAFAGYMARLNASYERDGFPRDEDL
ncbi:MarR family winged helix-turn-helix transcriptional regulator [Pseudarthrobacter sp. L19]|uniref:MarR family winged helix-turn-helix transcriptional regulator n=1 Tax=Pseudarthrobacter sp. L19 TaxID=3423951 RepID=UPI003D7A3E02